MSEGLCRGNSCCVVEEELEDVEFMRRTLYFAVRSLRWSRSVYGIYHLSTIACVKLEFQRETWVISTLLVFKSQPQPRLIIDGLIELVITEHYSVHKEGTVDVFLYPRLPR